MTKGEVDQSVGSKEEQPVLAPASRTVRDKKRAASKSVQSNPPVAEQDADLDGNEDERTRLIDEVFHEIRSAALTARTKTAINLFRFLDDILLRCKVGSSLKAGQLFEELADAVEPLGIQVQVDTEWQEQLIHQAVSSAREGARRIEGIDLAELADRWPANRLPKESPVAFIQRLYGKWIGNGLTRADIYRVDPRLYRALASWLQKKNNELPFELPTRQDYIKAETTGSAEAIWHLENRARDLEREAATIRRKVRRLPKLQPRGPTTRQIA